MPPRLGSSPARWSLTPATRSASLTAGAAPRPARASTARASFMRPTARSVRRFRARAGISCTWAGRSASPGYGRATCSSRRAAATSNSWSRRAPRSRRRRRASASATCRWCSSARSRRSALAQIVAAVLQVTREPVACAVPRVDLVPGHRPHLDRTNLTGSTTSADLVSAVGQSYRESGPRTFDSEEVS